MEAWLTLVVSAAAVIVAGLAVARHGEALAAGTGLGGMWIGAILIAAITSLPELATDLSAVVQGSPSLAVGDLFGSNMANMMILAVADLTDRRTRVLARVAIGQAAIGVLAILLAGVATLGILAGEAGACGVGWAVLLVAAGYAAGMRLLHANRTAPSPAPAAPPPGHEMPFDLGRTVRGLAVAAVVILVAAPFLAASASTLADRFGVSHGFVGMFLLAVTTSCPELVVSLAALRSGSYDLAVGNLLGSNCFNMLLLLPLDLVHRHGPLLSAVGPEVAVGAVASIVLTGIALLDILDRAERRRWWFEPGPVLLLAAYAASLLLVLRLEG